MGQVNFIEAAPIESKLIVQNQISEDQAKEIALKQVKGTVTKVELETENGVLVYEVDIKAPDQLYEVTIDAKSGKVIKVEKEND
ncbi:PepSY domain-containing protein [Bacillus sp. ISL-55]|nr:PepSY domain-containing protein [Bacillus sp. ISL-55]MBT2694063.1 PepSY domain-containing protein [Bacillus sp. ISL-55]